MNNFLIVSKLKSVDIKDPSLWTALSNILNNSSVKHLQPIIDIITSPWIDLMTNDRVGDVDSNAVVTVLVLIKIIMKVDISPFYIAKLFHLISLYPLRLFQKYVASWLLTLEYAELKLFLHRIKHSCDRLIEAGKASEDLFGLASLLASFPLSYYQNLSITENISTADVSDLEIDELCGCLQFFMWSFEYMLCNDKIDSDSFIRNQLIAWVQLGACGAWSKSCYLGGRSSYGAARDHPPTHRAVATQCSYEKAPGRSPQGKKRERRTWNTE